MKRRTRYYLGRSVVTLAMLLGLSCAVASQQIPRPKKKELPVSGDESRLFDLLNQARKENGLPALRWNPQLATAARRHADLMAERNELSHQFADESRLQERAADAAVRFSKVAENVGVGPSADRIHDLLMHSAGHRANILDPGSNEVGIASVRRDNSLFAVQDFAHTVPELDTQQQTALVAGLLQKEDYLVINTEYNAARFCENDNVPTLPGVTQIFHFEAADLSTLPDALKESEMKKRFRKAAVASCKVGPQPESAKGFTVYRMVVLLY